MSRNQFWCQIRLSIGEARGIDGRGMDHSGGSAVKQAALTIYTVGYGSRTQEELLNLLKLHKVQVVVDIRRWPTSKLEHFRREQLSRWLPAEGIDYVWMGEELGGYRRGGYGAHVTGEGFRRGVHQLLSLAAARRTCLLCLEISPRGCHRRFIATYLNSVWCQGSPYSIQEKAGRPCILV